MIMNIHIINTSNKYKIYYYYYSLCKWDASLNSWPFFRTNNEQNVNGYHLFCCYIIHLSKLAHWWIIKHQIVDHYKRISINRPKINDFHRLLFTPNEWKINIGSLFPFTFNSFTRLFALEITFCCIIHATE